MTMFGATAEKIDYIGYFDGACGPRNPGGHIGFGAAVYRGSKLLWETSEYRAAGPDNSNNVAEYMALNVLLDWLLNKRLGHSGILLRGDSNLVINQCFGTWKRKRGLYRPFAEQAQQKLQYFSSITGEWIPREQNVYADALSKRELTARGIAAL